MAYLRAQFEKAAVEVQTLVHRPGNDQLLERYALYKRATAGDCSAFLPAMLDLAGSAKYDAWARLEGAAADAAMKRYVDLVHRLQKGD